jgi:hypothetical protein
MAAQAPLQATSTGTADVKTVTLPKNAGSCLITVETTDARVTFDGTAPDSSHGIVFKIAQSPVYLPLGEGTAIKFVATSAASSVVSVIPLA